MNKEIIVKESARMFYEAGFKTVTMDDVANQLAVSKKTLYEVFGSKEQLISEVLEDEFEAIQNQFQQIQAQDLSAIEELMLLRKYIAQKFNGRQY
ncbi:TetR/AcrR family transcriptional regulator [Candidatus Ornithobacterium hominis]|nr:helix-turn-helix domain-containing protein [Candidatus Ornithobacterium hominis]